MCNKNLYLDFLFFYFLFEIYYIVCINIVFILIYLVLYINVEKMIFMVIKLDRDSENDISFEM